MCVCPITFSDAGLVGMALTYGLSLNISFIISVHYLSTLANHIISVERLNQYMHMSSEAPEIIEGNRPPSNWPAFGRIEIQNLQVNPIGLSLFGAHCSQTHSWILSILIKL